MSLLSEISMFGGLTDEQQNHVLNRLEVGAFKRRENIFQSGEEPTHIYLVKSGLVGLFISDHEFKIEKKRLEKGNALCM